MIQKIRVAYEFALSMWRKGRSLQLRVNGSIYHQKTDGSNLAPDLGNNGFQGSAGYTIKHQSSILKQKIMVSNTREESFPADNNMAGDKRLKPPEY